jgi:hypothetical protein
MTQQAHGVAMSEIGGLENHTLKPGPIFINKQRSFSMFELVDNWKKLWRADSVQLMLAAMLAPEFLEFAAANLNLLPPALVTYKEPLRVAFIGLAMLLRFRKQRSVE